MLSDEPESNIKSPGTYEPYNVYEQPQRQSDYFGTKDHVVPYTMTEHKLLQRNKKQNRGHFFHQLFVCITVTLGSIEAGYTIGLTCPKIRYYYNQQNKKYNPENAYYATILVAGLAMGNFFMSILSIERGPRRVMLSTAPFNMISWLVPQFVPSLNVRRVFMFFMAFCSSAYRRSGSLLLMDGIHETYYYPFFLIFHTAYGFGIMLGYIIGFHPLLQEVEDALGAALLGLFSILLFFCPESPVFVYRKSPSKARKAMIFFRGRQDITVLMRQLRNDNEARTLTVSTKYMFFYRVVYKSLLIILMVAILQIFYAYHIFILYDISLWYTAAKHEEVDIIGEFEDGVVLGISYYVVPFIGEAVNIRMPYGLRKPLLATAVAAPFSLLLHCASFTLLFHTDYLDNCEWLLYGVRIVHTIVISISQRWCLDAMIQDYLPEQVHVWAVVLVYTAKYFVLAIMLGLMFKLEKNVDAAWIIGFFAVVSFAGIPLCYWFVIETKGRTLQQVQMAIGGNPIGTRSSFRNRYQNYLAKDMAIKRGRRLSDIAPHYRQGALVI